MVHDPSFGARPDGLTTVLDAVETALRDTGLKFETWVISQPIRFGWSELDDPRGANMTSDRQDYCIEVGFAKLAGRGRLAVRTMRRVLEVDSRTGNQRVMGERVTGPRRLSDESLEVRRDAVRLLPDLVEALYKRAEEVIREITAAEKGSKAKAK
jgi:hypothetical protein